MGNTSSIVKKANFEDIQNMIKNDHIDHILINTLGQDNQDCLIKGTIDYQKEEEIINAFLSKQHNIIIIIYGKNSNDDSIYKKYKQLCDLGFTHTYVYLGGIFEWLLLQDIYGDDNFQTTKKELDVLKYKPFSSLHSGKLTIG